MPSPFPGMNPYLERPNKWRGIHTRFLTFASSALTDQLRGRYFVHIEESVTVRSTDGEPLKERLVPDLAFVERGRSARAASAAVLDTSEEVELVDVFVDEVRHRWIEIVDPEGEEVVTVVELLSPAKKATGPDREQYLRKRKLTLGSPAHLVEIDLLRDGPRLPLDGSRRTCDYYALVSRAELRPKVRLWRLRLRDALPTIPIPLKAGDADAVLDLKAVLDRVYDESTLADEIYGRRPEPPLSAKDAAWAKRFVPARS